MNSKSVINFIGEEFEKYGIEYAKDNASIIFKRASNDKTYQIDIRTFDIRSSSRSIKTPKSDWNYELPDNLYVALVIYVGEVQEPFTYLIPSNVFRGPDEFIFFDNDTATGFEHLSNWEIKIFTIEELSQFTFPKMIEKLK